MHKAVSWPHLAAPDSVSELGKKLDLEKHLHLWSDNSLGSRSVADRMPNPGKCLKRLEYWWNRVSEWPRQDCKAEETIE